MAFRNPLKSLLIQGSQLDPIALDGMTMHNVVITTTFPLTSGALTVNGAISSTGNVTARNIPAVTVSGVVFAGSYNSTYPLRSLYRRQTGVSDVNGLITVALDSTGIMWANAVIEIDPTYFLVLRPAESVAGVGGRCTWRTHRITDGVAVGGVGYTLMARIEYQNGP